MDLGKIANRKKSFLDFLSISCSGDPPSSSREVKIYFEAAGSPTLIWRSESWSRDRSSAEGKKLKKRQTKTETLLSSVSLALVLGSTCTTKSGRGEDEAQAASASSLAADLPTHNSRRRSNLLGDPSARAFEVFLTRL